VRVAFLGIRCIPARHGGGDTEAEQCAIRLAKRGHEIIAYVRRKYYVERSLRSWRGIRLVFVPTIETKNLGTPIHTLLSIVHLWCTKKKPDLVHLRGVGTALFILLLKPLRIPVVLSVDGKDWEREKWGPVAKRALFMAAWIGVRMADEMLVDSVENQKHYEKVFGRAPQYLSYGANRISTSDTNVYVKYGLKEGEYILWVGLFKPEKNTKLLIRAFEEVRTNKSLVLVGRMDEYKAYVDECKNTRDPRILFVGPVYGEDVMSIYVGAYLYCQPSLVEGTSPSLLTAMGASRCVVVSDIPENLETVGDSGVPFKVSDHKDLVEKLQWLVDNPSEVKAYGRKAFKRVQEHYDWDIVAAKTERHYLDALASRRKR